ncbi:MAG: glycoside hydrolase family 5 protein [Ruminococcaceae bacterium]|nr:glycoside hydrolase family 5 protein [Oscillospiraceae bacterium]
MRIKHIISSIVLAASMIVSAGCSTVKPAAEGSITATQMAEDMGIGLNLGNTMEAYNSGGCETVGYTWIPICGGNTPNEYERQWGAPTTTQECIDGIKAAGFDTIRIPVFWGNMMENDGTYTINPEYMARVREIVDYAQNAGLYTVINIHHFDEFIIRRNSLEECEKIFTTLWTQIANEFIDYPYTLVFEGYNEYLGGSQFDENGKLVDSEKSDAYKMVNTLNQTFVDAVRATGGNNSERVLIVSGYWTNIDLTTADEFIVPEDKTEDRLMVSVHYVDNAVYWSNKIGGQDWLDYIDNQCELLKKSFADKGIPVFLGETTGIYPRSNFAADAIYTNSTECLEIVLNKLKEHGFVPVLWDTSNNFYSRSSCMIKNEADRELIARLSE